MKKIKDKKGFTLVEMLVCVLTLLLVGAICTAGTGISIKSYQKARFETDSQMLQSTLDMLLSDVLRYATEVHVENDAESGVVTAFSNEQYGIVGGRILIPSAEESNANRLTLQKTPTYPTEMIVGENTYAENLYVSDFNLIYDTTTGIFSGSYKIKSTIMNDAEKNCEFTYRSIAVY